MTPLTFHILLYFLYSFLHIYVARNRKERVICLEQTPRSALYKCYAFSSFHYTIVGLTLCYYPLSSDYYQSFFPLFLCVQGGISYLSDVVYLERINHWSQYLDRTFASYNMMITLLVLRECFAHSKYELVVIALGIGVKKIDDHCFTNKYVESYMVFHILWHSILPVFGIYKAVRAT
jgi:hypothetical protein